jgi:hypothetical protein
MSVGSDTGVVNGTRFTFPTWASYAPSGYGQQSLGVPNVSPTVPAGLNQGGGTAGGAISGVGGYGTADNNTLTTSIAGQNPHNWKVSPVWWAVMALIVGLVLLKGVHFRDTIDSGVSEHARAGDASERAEAAAEA